MHIKALSPFLSHMFYKYAITFVIFTTAAAAPAVASTSITLLLTHY